MCNCTFFRRTTSSPGSSTQTTTRKTSSSATPTYLGAQDPYKALKTSFDLQQDPAAPVPKDHRVLSRKPPSGRRSIQGALPRPWKSWGRGRCFLWELGFCEVYRGHGFKAYAVKFSQPMAPMALLFGAPPADLPEPRRHPRQFCSLASLQAGFTSIANKRHSQLMLFSKLSRFKFFTPW